MGLLICKYQCKDSDAHVTGKAYGPFVFLCRRYVQVKGSAYYGEGDGIIYDRKYNCEGPLRFCFEYSDYCENNEDVGVLCSNGNVLKIISYFRRSLISLIAYV